MSKHGDNQARLLQPTWDYHQAFSRNLGLVTPEEQETIRQTQVSIAGMGGVGGVHLMTLVRMGFERFHIADFDRFELHNFNRQFGAQMASIGQPKALWMADRARDVNPDVRIKVFNDPITKSNAREFLKGSRVFVDGIDAFVVQPRREISQVASELEIFTVSAGPMGFSTSWLVFDPKGMSMDEYFGMKDGQSETELVSRFLAGVGPAGLHMGYMDRKYVDAKNHRSPSNMLACQLCAGVMGAETLKIALGRGRVLAAPYYQQFDAYLGRFVQRRMWFGGYNPLFQLRRRLVQRFITKAMSAKP